jgi:hypothetical protein
MDLLRLNARGSLPARDVDDEVDGQRASLLASFDPIDSFPRGVWPRTFPVMSQTREITGLIQ